MLEYSENFQGENPRFKTPLDAKRAGGKSGMRLTPEELKEWNAKTAEEVQYEISKYKLKNNSEVRELLEK